MEDFYKLLDQQRKEWYNEQILNDESKNNDSGEESLAKTK
jgi:hypothetical protein